MTYWIIQPSEVDAFVRIARCSTTLGEVSQRIGLRTDSLVFDRFTVDAMPQKGRLWKIFLTSAEVTQRLDLRFTRAVDD